MQMRHRKPLKGHGQHQKEDQGRLEHGGERWREAPNIVYGSSVPRRKTETGVRPLPVSVTQLGPPSRSPAIPANPDQSTPH
jgi:hypothetical protein